MSPRLYLADVSRAYSEPLCNSTKVPAFCRCYGCLDFEDDVNRQLWEKPASGVLGHGYNFKVLRVYTHRVSAEVVEVHPFGDCAFYFLIDMSMCPDRLAHDPCLAVA